MIPQQDKRTVSSWLGNEANLVAEEIVWRDDWQGHFRATRTINGIRYTITVTAEEECA